MRREREGGGQEAAQEERRVFSGSEPLARLTLSVMSPPVDPVNPDSAGGPGRHTGTSDPQLGAQSARR